MHVHTAVHMMPVKIKDSQVYSANTIYFLGLSRKCTSSCFGKLIDPHQNRVLEQVL